MNEFTDDVPKKFTIEEYLAIEENSKEKLEFYNGEIVPRFQKPSIRIGHHIIAANIVAALANHFDEMNKPYTVLCGNNEVYCSDIITKTNAIIVCHNSTFHPDALAIIRNPLLIVDFLFFRQGDYFNYKKNSSFKEYVLIEQKIPFVTSSFKMGERTWKGTEADGLDSSIYLQSIDCTIDLKKIYKGVKF